MSSLRTTERKHTVAPQNDDGHYICFRECADGNPCQRTINAPWMPCYDHFGEPPMRQAADERE